MAEPYIPQEIEPKWQKKWEEDHLYRSVTDPSKPKHYALTMLPYPSGDLHIGHWYATAPSDVRARFMRMRGYNVLFPMGFDAFGLPAENAAIERGIHPYTWTMSNIEKMRRQLKSMGAMFDWEREAVSCLPGYYLWTQWFFRKMYDMGLAYRKRSQVDFCPKCNTTLAREQVWGPERVCERCRTPVIKKELEQWFCRITNYADELLDFSKIDWPERVVAMQTNWIGRSEGANVTFRTERGDPLVVFTTRPDTLWGATFMVLAPEHPLVDELTAPECRTAVEKYQYFAARQSEIDRLSTEKEKTGLFIGAYAINPVNSERIPIWISDYVLTTYGTGAIMGVPAHDDRDFVLALKFGLPVIPVIDHPEGTRCSFIRPGAVEDGLADSLARAGFSTTERDDGFLVAFNAAQEEPYIALVREYVRPDAWVEIVGGPWKFIFADRVMSVESPETEKAILARCQGLNPVVRNAPTVAVMLWEVPPYRRFLFHARYGPMINSGPLTGMPGDVSVKKTTEWLAERGIGEFAVSYKLRDWCISRQRYWGAPIPIIYCDCCGIAPVPYEDLPVILPTDAVIPPTGENALKYHEGFLHTTCPQCGGPATRETDTMDTFVCSSWYQYAYLSPYYKEGEPAHADSTPFDPEEGKYWLPVDVYTGGIEHATMHLIYTRFFTKVMRDIGLVDFDEPMIVLRNQGIILGADGEKMSKSRGNVIAPDELVARYGADTVRGYLMFGWRWEQGGPWDPKGIEGVHRWLNRVWNLALEPAQAGGAPSPKEIAALRRWTHRTIQRVTNDMENFEFNTVISALMEFTNALYKFKETPAYGTEAWKEAIETLLLLLAPCCPPIAEELWVRTGRPYSIHLQSWPQYDPNLLVEEVITLVVQVNGKVRARLEVPADISEEAASAAALADANIRKYVEGKEIRQFVYVPGRLINIVVG